MDAFVIPRSPAGAITGALGLPRAVNGTSAVIESASTNLGDPAPAWPLSRRRGRALVWW